MSRLLDRRNARKVNVNGLRRDPRTGAGKLAKSERGYGGVLALDFTDNSAAVYDPTTQANVAYSQGVTDGNGNFRGPHALLTYTSPSNKLTMQSDGYIKYQAHNLILQSEDFSTTWNSANMLAFGAGSTVNATTAPDGTTTADLLTPNTTSGVHTADITSVSLASQVGHHSIYVKPNGYTKVAIKETSTTGKYASFNLSGSGSVLASTSDASSVTLGDNGWYRITMTVSTAATQQFRFYILPASYTTGDPNSVGSFAADGVSGVYVWGAHVRNNNANTDYIRTTTAAKYALPIEYDTSGNCLGLLVEEARTNVLLGSGDTDNASYWLIANVTTATAEGLDGVSASATTGTAIASGGSWRNSAELTLTAAAYTFSVYAKAGTTEFITLRGAFFTTNFQIGFNLSTGVADTGGVITDVGNGWYRCSVTWTPGGADVAGYMYIYPANGLSANTSDIGDSVTIWAPQLEAGSFPTSPIITYGSTATRAADQKAQLTSTFPLSATAGSLYAYVVPYAGSDLAGIVSLNDGSGNEEIVIYKDASANIVAQVEDGGVGQLAPLDSTVNASSNTAFKVALAWAANDFALSANGTAAQTDTGGTLPTVTTLEIGVDQANNYFNGIIKAIAYWPRRRADSELQTVTT